MATGKYQEWLKPDGLLLLEAWARDGLTDEQLAHNIGICVETLYAWKRDYPQISKALKKGKEVVDIQVENALLKRALGYRYDEVTRELVYNRDTGMDELKETKRVTKEVLPDVAAQAIWLKNRKPTKWRDKPEATESAAFEKLDTVLKEMRDNAVVDA